MSKFRGDYVPEVEALGQAMGEMFVAIFERIGHENIVRSCATCKNWQEGEGVPVGCKLFQMLPPVKIIVTGCDSHDDICEIPF